MAESQKSGQSRGLKTQLDGYEKFREHFYARMKRADGESLAFFAIDMDLFKLYNEIYGRAAGNRVLQLTARRLEAYAGATDAVAGYFGNDDFALLAPCEKGQAASVFELIWPEDAQIYQNGFYPSAGVCYITDYKDSFEDVYDRAKIALDNIRDSFTEHIAVFDQAEYDRVREEHTLLLDAQKGLKYGEFSFVLQPKCDMQSGKIVGAEALMRWHNKKRGQVPPGTFIPILEQHNAISLLDTFIWEEVCKWLKSLIDDGVTPLPVSLNVSRTDFRFIDLAKHFSSLVKRYELEPSLIELEITESAFVDASLPVRDTINRLSDEGFLILMDDFGAGYSSLNSLRDLNFDILKTDIRFLDRKGHSRRGIDIMESINNMSRLLGAPMVVEGVETRDQVDDLVSIGCRYAQGYFFHKPMDPDHFRQMIANPYNVDRSGMTAPLADTIGINEFLESNLYSDETLNSILGAVAFLEMSGEDLSIVRTNDRFRNLVTRELGEDGMEQAVRELSLHREDAMRILSIAETNLVEGVSDIISVQSSVADTVRFLLRAYLLNERSGRKLFYINLEKIEPKWSDEDLWRELRDVQGRLSFLRAALNRLPNPIFMKDGDARFLFFNDQYAKAFGMRRSDYVGKTVLDLDYLPRDDRERFQQEDVELIRTESELSYESDFLFSDDMTHYSLYWSTGVHDKKSGRRGLVGEIVDITKEHKIRNELDRTVSELKDTNHKLEEMTHIDPGTGLFNRLALHERAARFHEGSHINRPGIMCDLDRFKAVNDVHGHAVGDKCLALFGRILLEECAPDDLPARYGGDEFFIAITDTDREAALALAERIRSRCEKEILLPDGSALTVSIGVSDIDSARTFVQNIDGVDRSLYLAKKAGGNRVISAFS